MQVIYSDYISDSTVSWEAVDCGIVALDIAQALLFVSDSCIQ